MNPQAGTTQNPATMRLSDIITSDRILVDREGALPNKAEALRALSRLLGSAVAAPEDEVLTLLLEREQLQSTGIGDGVAIVSQGHRFRCHRRPARSHRVWCRRTQARHR